MFPIACYESKSWFPLFYSTILQCNYSSALIVEAKGSSKTSWRQKILENINNYLSIHIASHPQKTLVSSLSNLSCRSTIWNILIQPHLTMETHQMQLLWLQKYKICSLLIPAVRKLMRIEATVRKYKSERYKDIHRKYIFIYMRDDPQNKADTWGWYMVH